METNIIIAIMVVSIVVAGIIMNWIEKQKLIKVVDNVFELLINPAIQSLNLQNGEIEVDIKKEDVKNYKSWDYDLTSGYRLKIMKESAIGITGLTKLTVCLVDKKDKSLYSKHIEISGWE